MGVAWSDVLYPDNPKRRDAVNALAQRIRITLVEFYAEVRTLAGVLHNKVSTKYQDLPAFNYDLTFQQNLNQISTTMEQWKSVVEELEKDSSIPQAIRNAVAKLRALQSHDQFPDAVKDITGLTEFQQTGAGAAVGFAAGAIASVWTSVYFIAAFTSVIAAVSVAGLLGAVVGLGIAVLVDVVIGAIQGYEEREELEKLEAQYSALAPKLENATRELNVEIQDIVSAITTITSKYTACFSHLFSESGVHVLRL